IVIWFGLKANRLAVISITRGLPSARALRGVPKVSSMVSNNGNIAVQNQVGRDISDFIFLLLQVWIFQDLLNAVDAGKLARRELHILDIDGVHQRFSGEVLVHQADSQILEWLVFVEGHRFLLWHFLRIRKGKNQGTRRIVMDVLLFLVLM